MIHRCNFAWVDEDEIFDKERHLKHDISSVKLEFEHSDVFATMFVFCAAQIIKDDKYLLVCIDNKPFFKGKCVGISRVNDLLKVEFHAKPSDYQTKREQMFERFGLNDILFQKQQTHKLIEQMLTIDKLSLKMIFNKEGAKTELKRYIPSTLKQFQQGKAIAKLAINLHLNWKDKVVGFGNLLDHVECTEPISLFNVKGQQRGNFTIIDANEHEIQACWHVDAHYKELVQIHIKSNINTLRVSSEDKKLDLYIKHDFQGNSMFDSELGQKIMNEVFRLAELVLERSNRRYMSELLIPIEDALDMSKGDLLHKFGLIDGVKINITGQNSTAILTTRCLLPLTHISETNDTTTIDAGDYVEAGYVETDYVGSKQNMLKQTGNFTYTITKDQQADDIAARIRLTPDIALDHNALKLFSRSVKQANKMLIAADYLHVTKEKECNY